MNALRTSRQQGFSLVEVLVSAVLVGAAVLAAATYMSKAAHGAKRNRQKDFAIQKAISMLEELKAATEFAEGDAATILDDQDDGTQTQDVLTTDADVTDPAHALSGNTFREGTWDFSRQITVRKLPSLQSKDVRLVNVKVFGKVEGTSSKTLLAEVSGVIGTTADNFPPSQVYDVYCLAIENVPGWWVYMANLVPFVDRAIQEISARNPGLEFRVHWITELSYGRDRQYKPFINQANDSEADIDWAYFYPGTLPSGSAVGSYYVPDAFEGQLLLDGTAVNGFDATDNPLPYAVADSFNHAMRYPDERALFDARVAAGLSDPGRPTWRLLIEDMYTNPDKYRNALLVNVHGEMFPFPPLRNYSDAAKDPEDHPRVRAVAHPEQLRFDNADDVGIRVYSYLTDPGAFGTPDRLSEPISVTIRGVSSLPNLVVESCEGGLDLSPADGSPDSYAWETGDTSGDHAGDMYYDVTAVSGGVRIRLYNSPVRTPCAGSFCNGGGIDGEKRLYGYDYIPTPIAAAGSAFGRDLTASGNVTKNTARWRIVLADADLPDDARIDIETRIGSDLSTGTLYPTANEPANLSKTYAWRGSDTWIFGDGTAANPPHLPWTERYQIQGDGRHNPYADLREDYDATTNRLGTGYNRYFDDFDTAGTDRATDAAYWDGFRVKSDTSENNDGWNWISELDINRVFQLMRGSLQRSNVVFTSLAGFSFYYIGIGGEIGYDAANGFPDSIPVSDKPFSGTSGSRYEQSITSIVVDGNPGGIRVVKENLGSGYWWSRYWLGELYPDDLYATWAASGNIPTGVGSDRFVRVSRPEITEDMPTGTSWPGAYRSLLEGGSTTMFSIGDASSKFHHQYIDGYTGDLVLDGADIREGYNFTIPEAVQINRPFGLDLDADGPVPDHYREATYEPADLVGSILATYYDHNGSSLEGSGVVELEGPDSDSAFLVINGVAQTVLTGSAFIGRWSFLTLIQTYFNAGLSPNPARIVQLPRVSITAPNDATDLTNPGSVAVSWDDEWKRWDGKKYADAYADSFTESVTVRFRVMYSDDGGDTWRHGDGTAAQPGVRPSASYLQTATTATVPTPAGTFPQGSYIVRVEAFRDGYELHYSYHQQKIFIKRS